MSTQVTHIATKVRERGASSVSEIGGRSRERGYWRQDADTPLVDDYYVLAGGHRVPVERRRNAEQGYHYFVAVGREEGSNLLLHLPALP